MNIIQEIKDEIKAVSVVPTKRDMNILAVLFLVIPCAVGAHLLYWRDSAYGWVWLAIGIVLFLSRFIPPLFSYIFGKWVALSIVLGYFISRILLTLIFFLVIMPTGFIMKLFGKDPMDRKLDPEAKTYWIKHEQPENNSIERYEKQF
jgi:hypothetical protein